MNEKFIEEGINKFINKKDKKQTFTNINIEVGDAPHNLKKIDNNLTKGNIEGLDNYKTIKDTKENVNNNIGLENDTENNKLYFNKQNKNKER